ncbi:MAG: hypothetical protein IT258_01960, partial [Saprospiraceae bacterium]|nr:hypothetical protein [Saprospiraceae bacterium]
MKQISLLLGSIKCCIFLSFITFWSCDTLDGNKLSIEPLQIANRTDTALMNNNLNTYKLEAFLLSGYYNSPVVEAEIDSFVCIRKDSFINNFVQYTMLFYKRSSVTNVKHLVSHPRDLVRYSQNNDMLYEYSWQSG